MTENDKYKQSLSFWRMGFYFLNIPEIVFNKTIESENAWCVISEYSIDEKIYVEKTSFSDFNIIVPCLYNLYHSFELLFKGFLLLKNEVKPNHKIEQLYFDFKVEYPEQTAIFEILDRYIIIDAMCEPLKSFFKINNITTNQFYEALRYPTNKNLTVSYCHLELMYKDKEGLFFFKNMIKDIDDMKSMFVRLGRSFEA